MPFLLIGLIAVLMVVGPYLPASLVAALYGLSLSIKSVLILVLPFLIFGLIFKAAVHLARKASLAILVILVGVCLSNFLATFLSHFVGAWVYTFDLTLIVPEAGKGLTPLWSLALPKVIANEHALFAGILFGLLMSRFKPHATQTFANHVDRILHQGLRIFLYVIPFFIAGFVAKMQYDGVIGFILKDYAVIFAIVGLSVLSYILFLYWVAARFKGSTFLKMLKNMLPAGLAGFSTMSSAAAMPLTIIGVERNSGSGKLANAAVPSTLNIHLMGDCFAIPIFAYALLKNFDMASPDLVSYLIFALYFVLAKFSVAAIPGGGIIVMLPLLEKHLGFNGEMMSFITALYILFDPVITTMNVLGNGVFSVLLGRSSLFRKEERST